MQLCNCFQLGSTICFGDNLQQKKLKCLRAGYLSLNCHKGYQGFCQFLSSLMLRNHTKDFVSVYTKSMGLPWFLSKESACNAGELGSIPGSGRSPEEGNGYPLQYSCLENSMDRGAWRAIVHGVTKSQTQLSD